MNMKYNYNKTWSDNFTIYNVFTYDEIELNRINDIEYIAHNIYNGDYYIGDTKYSIYELIEMLEKDWNIVEE